MRAIVITHADTQANTELVERPKPTPSDGQVLVDVAYCGCNWADTMVRRGTYPHAIPYPFVPGFEISGIVSMCGSDVTDFKVGDRIAGYVEPGGGYAQYCVADPACLTKLPDDVGLDVGAAFPLQGMTAWHMLHTVARVEAGQTILVHAIGGGVGLNVTQIAVHSGCRVIGTVGTPAKAAKALAYGASRVVVRGTEDFVQTVDRETMGKGVDVVIDSLGAETLDRSFACTRNLGHVVSIGEAEGRPYNNIWERILPKSLTFTRFHLGHVEPGSELARNAADDLLDGLRAGWLQAPIAGVFPLEKALEMQMELESRQVPGKLLLKIGD